MGCGGSADHSSHPSTPPPAPVPADGPPLLGGNSPLPTLITLPEAVIEYNAPVAFLGNS